MFDPSVVSDGRGNVFLSFSAVDPNETQSPPHNRRVSTYLASSNDGGATWSYLARPANPSVDVEIGQGTATWQHEVSTLSYDDLGDKTPVWRLMSHHYPLIDGRREFRHGWIALKSADTFEGLTHARETKLFVGKAYKALEQQPVPGDAVLDVSGLHRDVARCAILTEPGLFANQDAVYLALHCIEVGPPWRIRHKVIWLACDRPCAAENQSAWRYVSTLLSETDIRHRRHKYYSAPAIFVRDERHFLVATPVGDQPFEEAYDGCDIFLFDDLARGEIVRENGQAERQSRIEGLPGSFNGACALNEDPTLTLLSQLRIVSGRAYFDIVRPADER